MGKFNCSLPFIALAGIGSLSAQQQRPNVIFILTDDLGWTDLGCYGSTFYETPNLDLLAQKGTRFTNAYAACPVSSPTRASIQTGKYPARLQITDWIPGKYSANTAQMNEICPVLPPDFTQNLPLEEITLGKALQQNGYKTIHIGKWHICEKDTSYYPQHHGYDVNIGGCWMGAPIGSNGYFVPYNNPMLPDGPEGEYLTDRLGDECVNQIRKNKDKPFFINLNFYQVHTPLVSKADKVSYFEGKAKRLGLDTMNVFLEQPEWISKQPFPASVFNERVVQSNAVYAAMLSSLDENIGKVIQELKAQNLWDNTILIFTSDNGGLSTSEGSPTSNLPLRGGKGFMNEGGIRVPMIAYTPENKLTGMTSEAIITSVDYFPTIMEITGSKVSSLKESDGKSFLPVLKGEAYDRDAVFWHYPHYPNQGGRPSGAIREGDYKLIEYYDDNSVELFNLQNDINEAYNLSATHPEIANELLKKLYEWREKMNAVMPTANPDKNNK